MKSFVRPRWAVLLMVGGIIAASCAKGIEDTTPPDEGDEGGGSPASSSGAGGSGGLMGSGGAGGGGGAGGAGGGGVGGNGAGGGAESALLASLSSMAMTMNCMPGATPAINGSFQAFYDNKTGVSGAFAIVNSAKLTMSLAADSYVWSFDVMPKSTFVSAGSTSNATHSALMGSGSGDGALCDYCGQIWTLQVQWDVGGKTTTATLGPSPVSCAQ